MSREVTAEKAQPILSKDDLLPIFVRGARAPGAFKIGLETEKVGFYRGTQAVPFDGPDGIEAILIEYGQRFGWNPIRDRGRVIALEQGSRAITLEPGGQLELSGAAVRTVNELDAELAAHLRDLAAVSAPRGVQWGSVGIHPFLTLDTAVWMPKSRYAIMRKHYDSHGGGMGHQMMKLTASSQFNMDFTDEADARRKIKVGSLLGPVVAAMAANSYVERGVPNGFCARRLEIWKYTDADRCGTPPFFTDGTFSFEKYRDWAMRVPMYFTVRDGEYVDQHAITFERYLETARGQATQADWVLHLTTLFPDVRLKDHLEFRTADATPAPYTLALAAFWIGVMYDAPTLLAVEEALGAVSHEALRAAMDDVSRRGLAATFADRPILDVARKALALAEQGLARVDAANGSDQVHYLAPLRALLERGKSPAEIGREAWTGEYAPAL